MYFRYFEKKTIINEKQELKFAASTCGERSSLLDTENKMADVEFI